jgi:hypothetical protein
MNKADRIRRQKEKRKAKAQSDKQLMENATKRAEYWKAKLQMKQKSEK